MLSLKTLTWGAVLASVVLIRNARADAIHDCVDASNAGQQQRDEGHYRAARSSFVACSQPACPAPIRLDCSQWLADLLGVMPSILVAATDVDGRDLSEVRVTVDGQPLAPRLDGVPKAVDPGPHVLRFEATGMRPEESRVVVRVGDKNRLVRVTLRRMTATSAEAGRREGANAASDGSQPFRSLAWVLGGVSVLGFGSEAYFGISGIEQRNRDTAPGACAPYCAPSEKTAVQTKFLAADISLGVGVVAAAAAVYFLVRSLHRADAASAPASTAGALRPTVPGLVGTF